jgi:RNA processing factor Prp31
MNATTHSYTEWAAEQRHEPGAGLSIAAKIDAFVADVTGAFERRAMRRQLENDARARRDAREQFLARMEEI